MKRHYSLLRVLPLVVPLLLCLSTAKATVFTVTNTNDTGPGSLRQAILDANAAGTGPHSIDFAVYGQITLFSSLPVITAGDFTIDGENKITINSNGLNQIINPFNINANNVTVRNFTLTNSGDLYFSLSPNTTGITIEDIRTFSTVGSYLNGFLAVNGNSTNLTVRDITCSDVEACQGGEAWPYRIGRAFIFFGGQHNNLVMDNIRLRTLNNATGCEGVVFRDASVNGWTLTNSDILGFRNGIVLDNTGGPVETAKNIQLNHVVVDSVCSGIALGFYSDFVDSNIVIRNTRIDQNIPGTTDDGDHNIRFDNAATAVILDSVTATGTDGYTIWFNGPASNIRITNSSIDCAEGEPTSQLVRFEGTVTDLVIRNTVLNTDRPGTVDDGDHALVFLGATTNTTLDNLTINECDVDGIYVVAASTNFRLTHSRFTNNFDGIEFYNNVARSNVDIDSSSFTNSGRSGIVVNGANAVTDVDITGDTVTGNVNHGIWFYGGAGITDVLVSGNVIRDNGGAGINNDAPNKVVITNNSIFNNTGLGIANPTGNCAYTAAANRTPVLVSSTAAGAGQYQLQIDIPNITAGAVYEVDIYANDPAVTVSSGQTYVTTLTGLSSGTSTHTITWSGSQAGFWTATLRIPLNNCGTSEFGNKIAISPQGPGNVDANVKLWLRADAGLTSNGFAPTTDGQVVNRWNDFSQGGAPNGATSVGTNAWKKAGINFNPAAYFNGTGAFQAATPGALTPWINSAAYTSFAVFNQYTTAADGSRLYVMYDQASGGFDYNTNQASLIFARNGANVQTHRGNAWENPVAPNALGRPGLFASVTNATSHSLHHNGINLGSAAYNKGNIHAEQWFVGAGYANGWCCGTTADVAEIITYDRELTAAEITQVQSYLALKYGISKAGNYVASDGTTIYWDSTANTVYNRHITGIGRDDSTFLLQKQSLSVDTGIVTLALGASIAADNAANGTTIGTNRSFFLFGDNGAAATYTTAASGTYVNQRMARVWKVQKTAWTDQSITLKINGAGANNYLLIGSDPTFAAFTQELQLDGTGSITLNSSQLAGGIYFTIGARIQGPSSVTAGIAMWLRADDGGASGAQWSDFSGIGNTVIQTASANQAVKQPASINFNPALKFDGANDYLSTSSLFTGTGINNMHVYGVAATDAAAGNALFAEMTSNGNYLQAHVPFTDGNLYWDAPFGYRIATAWGGATTIPYLWTFTRSAVSGLVAYRNKRSMGTFAGPLNNIAGNNSRFNVGSQNAGGNPFNGRIGELIVYNNSATITNTQRLQIESYLALKYGLTLSPAAPVDYLSSDSTVKMWTAASNTGFGWHITGIGRDSVNMLNQKQSVSADTGFIIVSLGSDTSATNAANPNTISNDRSFLVFGDNGAALNFTRPVAGLTNVDVAFARTWKLQKTAWADQNITFVANSSMALPQYLLISTDTAFGTGDVALPMTTGKITLNSSQLPDGVYFTFGNTLKAPGAVTAGIRTWYRADDPTANTTNWYDFSGNDVIASQTVAASQPALMQSGLNFNPAYTFNGTQFFRFNGTRMPVGISARTILLVTSNAAGGWVFSYGHPDPASVGARYNFAIGGGARNLEISNSQYGNGGGNTTTPNITSLAHAQNTFNSASQVTVNGGGLLPWGFQLVGNQVINTLSYPNGYLGGTVFNNSGPSYNGRIGEVVVYDKVLTASEKNRVESYLALKYGITLDQATPANYTASDSTTRMWTAADNVGYNRHITGIGRDDLDSLHQKQSLSVDTGIVTIALGAGVAATNAANTAVVTNNLSFLTFGDNGAAPAYLTLLSGLTDVNSRMNRVFKVDKTNWADQNVTLKLSGGSTRVRLVVSSDPSFGTGDALYPMNADSTVTINSSNLPDGAYFTFATFIKGPNAVTRGLNFWLRADDGASDGSRWNDYSGHENNALQATVASQPVTDAKGINFNYSLRFDGANDFLDINTTRVNPDSATIFVAGSGSGFAAVRDLVSSGAVGSAHGMEFRLSSASGGLQWLENAASVSGFAGVKTYVENRPYLFGGTQTNLTNGIKLYQNYGLDAQGTINLSPLTANLVSIGSRTIAARGLFWQGNISEVIVYDRVLQDAERQMVESYLGLKYGITLNNGSTAYLASDSTVYWTADATYKNRITGIGRDDSTALDTKQSLSVDTGFVTMALGNSIALTNEENTASITNDKSFLVFADNGLSVTDYNNPVAGVNATQRISRVWKVDKTSWTDQNITLSASVTGSDNYLLVSTDPTFATLNQELPLSATGLITLNSSLLTDGVYFTFGRPVVAPGCVATPVLWLKANEGVTAGGGQVSSWTDASGSGNTTTQATAANQPQLVAAGVNFNPAIDFDGINDFVTSPLNINAPGADPLTAFTVYRADALSANNRALWGNDNGSFDRFMKLDLVSGNDADVAYAGGNVAGRPIINSAVMDDGATNGSFVYINGQQAVNFTHANSAGGATTTNIGNWGTAGYFDGTITEQIFYNRLLNNTELRQVNTYLAIKYGITATHDYLATGTADTLWHVTGADSAYKSNIAGIWRQDCSALYQKQSRSVNDTNEVIIGATSVAATNAANTGSFDNGNFLVWGANGTAAYTFNATFDGAASRRLNRVWKVRDNGSAGQVQLAIPKAALLAAGVPGACEAYKLLVSNTSADPGTAWDATNATEYTLSEQTINGVTCYATTLSFTADADRYFTVGRLLDKGAHPYLVADGSVTAAADECETSDWIYFLDPLDDTRRILAIKKNGNTIDENDFTAKVDVSTSYATPSNSPLGKAITVNNQPALFLMRRLVEISFTPQVGHSIDTPVYVRMYWDNGSVSFDEKQMARDNLNTLIADSGITVTGSAVFEWFKAGGQDIAATLTNMNATGVYADSNGSQKWSEAPDADHVYGTDGSLPYVEFRNVMSFSTFGGGWFVNQTDNSILPVEILSFNAWKEGRKARLDWEVVNQQNVRGYRIQRSPDGANWTETGFVAAKPGSGKLHYTYYDHAPLNGRNYYRLRQEDNSGAGKYSEVRLVNFSNGLFDVSLHPVPVTRMLTATVDATTEEEVVLTITDVLGRKMSQRQEVVKPGRNLFYLLVSELSPGTYVLDINGTKHSWKGKFIKASE